MKLVKMETALKIKIGNVILAYLAEMILPIKSNLKMKRPMLYYKWILKAR